jgi:hypothetical protein
MPLLYRVREIEVDAGAILRQSGRKPSAWARKDEGAVVEEFG